MPQRTEQQQRLHKYLMDLISVAGNYLTVDFVSQSDAKERGKVVKTEAIKRRESVYLCLVEPLFGADYDEWAEAIVEAEEYLGFLEKERFYRYENPSFFEAITAEVRDKTNTSPRIR
jgi:hypothetical protein